MRAKKARHAKRAVEFFTVCCHFKQPYKVLLDGNFIHMAREFKMGDLKDVIGALLGAASNKTVKLYVTPCILTELKNLGADFEETVHLARKHSLVLQCTHENGHIDAKDCILSCVGDTNAEHYFVGSQDRTLRSALKKVQGGATLFISVNGVHIEQPSNEQRHLAGQKLAENMAPSEKELKTPALEGLDQLRSKLATSSKFRRKKAKGPNPMAVRPPKSAAKKKRPGPRLRKAMAEQAAAGEQTVPEGSGLKRKRKRKKGGKSAEE